jgi:LDH2 family malate/lactate/ureidoglycolate dehydrogenase
MFIPLVASLTSKTVDMYQTDPHRLCHLASESYIAMGVPTDTATHLADTLVQADLWGHSSHGVMCTFWYGARIASWKESAPQDGIAEIMYPGEPEHRHQAAARATGLALPADVVSDLVSKASSLGIAISAEELALWQSISGYQPQTIRQASSNSSLAARP